MDLKMLLLLHLLTGSPISKDLNDTKIVILHNEV